MDMNEYQDRAATTAIYPDAGTGSLRALSYLGLGLGETGEVQGKLKKVLRDDDGIVTPEVREAVAGELGDVLWYVAMLARELNLSLDDIAADNIEKLAWRAARGVIKGSGDNR
jgi:NTP pyrophosphatase (non-canonical NTP hydrolase)